MGVNQLWSILAPIKIHKTLKSLKGQIIVIDLSVWICESASALQGLPVAKPHLRNLFFRVTNLTQLGINLIFVLDGEPPELKWDEMERRTNARFQGGARGRWGHWRSKRPSKTAAGGEAVMSGKKKKDRKRFKFIVKECQEMLESLGIPCVQAAGEAEAMCALMNVQGLADACLTEDGDVFLYGARTVYKNFTLNIKDPHIECYSMDDIESQLGLDQSKLVALGLLLGCDYTLGVLGVGPKQAVGLMQQLGSEVEVLDRFRDWASGKIPRNCLQEAAKKSPHCARCSHVGSGREQKVYGCAMCNSDMACHPKSVNTPECSCPWHVSRKTKGKASLESDVMKKACVVPGFPSEPVIDEFLTVKDKCPTTKLSWKRPQLISAQKFISSKLEWPEDYTVEKVFPMVTLWDLTAISCGQSFDPKLHLMPTAVVKKRIRQGVACVEVQWQTGIPHSELESPTTIEKEDLFAKAFPELMAAFVEAKAARTKPKRKKTGKSTAKDPCGSDDHLPTSNQDDLDYLTSAVGELSLVSHAHTQPNNFQSSSETDLRQDDSQSLSDQSEAEEDCSGLPPSLYQRLGLSPNSKGPRINQLLKSDPTDSNPADISVECEAEVMTEAVSQCSRRSQSVLVSGHGDIKPVIKNSGKIRSLSDACDKDFFEDLTFPDSRFSSTSSAEDRPPMSSANGPSVRNINVKPLCCKSSWNKEITTASKGNASSSSIQYDNEAEPLPLSERLRLKEAVETITLDDSSGSSSADDEGTSTSTFLDTGTSVAEESEVLSTLKAESFHDRSSLSVEEISETPSSTQVDVGCSVNSQDANFSLGFELTKMLLNDDTLVQTKECVSNSNTSDQGLSRIEHFSSSKVIEGGSDAEMDLPTSSLLAGQRELFPEFSANIEVPGGIIHPHKPPPVQAAHDCSSFALNFSLKFDMTKVLNEEESLLQRNDTSEMEDTDKNPSEKQGPPEISQERERLTVSDECKEMFLPSEVQNNRCAGTRVVDIDQTSLDASLKFCRKSDLRQTGDTSTGEENENQDDDTEDISFDFKEKLRGFLQKFENSNGLLEKNEKLGRNCEELKSILLQDDEAKLDECDFELNNDHSLVLKHGGLGSESPFMSWSTCGRGHFSSQIPAGDLCHTFAPLPIDVDTPVVDDESFLGASKQSEPARLRVGENEQPITTPVTREPRKFKDLNISRINQGVCHQSLSRQSISQSGNTLHCEQMTANHKAERSLNNQLEFALEEVENSPVSLLDRLRRKHGNQNGVLSAALKMKNGSKFGGKPGQPRKVLMEIFDDDNEADDAIL